MSSYQLAIALDTQDSQLKHALEKELGGAGTGSHTSLAQYIGNELSRQIARGDHPFAEGAFMSNERVRSIVYRTADGSDIESSLIGTVYDMALFRLL